MALLRPSYSDTTIVCKWDKVDAPFFHSELEARFNILFCSILFHPTQLT